MTLIKPVVVLGPVVMGDPDYRHLRRIMTNPPGEILTDAGIDMRQVSQLDPHKRWWLAMAGEQVLAFCAIWHTRVAGGGYESGHNYELGWRDRGEDKRYWPLVYQARQEWIVAHQVTATTWLHDEPPASGATSMVVRLHLASGWTQVDETWSLDNPTQYCRQLVWPGR